MKGDLTWCKFRFSWIKVFKTLSNTEKDRLLDAIEAYTNDKEMPELLGKESVAWALIETELEADKESRRKAADSHREAGRNGGRPKTKYNQIEPNETKYNQIGFSETNQNQNGLRVKELRDKEVKDFKNDICASAHVSAPEKPKLTPNDHDFWKFAKENAEMAKVFYQETGLKPIKSQFGLWVNSLRDLSEAGIDIDRMRKTISFMQSEGTPIYSPGSLLKTAQMLKSRGSVPALKKKRNDQPQQDRWDAAAEKLNAMMSSYTLDFLPQEHESEVIDI